MKKTTSSLLAATAALGLIAASAGVAFAAEGIFMLFRARQAPVSLWYATRRGVICENLCVSVRKCCRVGENAVTRHGPNWSGSRIHPSPHPYQE